MQSELSRFCREVLDWVEAGCPEHDVLAVCKPLCCVPFEKFGYSARLLFDLQVVFEKDYGCNHFPFGGEEVWDAENELGDFYNNGRASEQRIEFLRRYACST